MDKKEIQSLVKLINDSNISELKLEDGDFKLTIRTKEYHKASMVPVQKTVIGQPSIPIAMPQSVPPVVGEPKTSAPIADANNTQNTNDSNNQDNGYLEIKSPIVGTFYRAPAPDKDPYVKVGDVVNEKSIVCIVEAMKLFNEIEAEVNGKIIDILVEDASPIEYDQVLFIVDPKG